MELDLVEEAARIFCEEALTDYRAARDKAAERLGLPLRNARADAAEIQTAVVRYQRLFGGQAYTARLSALRHTAVKAMKLLSEFEPRLVGALISGAITESHRVQLHAFADKPEQLDGLLQQRNIPYEVNERHYRFTDGREETVPVLSFGEAESGVDVAVFSERETRLAPLSSVDRAPMKRLSLLEAEALAASPPEVISA
ncbi:MAG: hypothetical protein AABY95_11895 [Pseudomonadota bacterium]